MSTVSSLTTVSVVPPVTPLWWANLANSTWTQVATVFPNRLQDNYPSPIPNTGLSGESSNSISGAWSGAAVDTVRREYILCANGGHADYPGNEAYALSLGEEIPRWRRLSDPTPNGVMPTGGNFDEGNGRWSDGRPRAMHNCFVNFGDGRVWIPFLNSVSSGGGGSVNGVFSYNRDSLGAASTPLPWTSQNLGPWVDHGAVAGMYPNPFTLIFGVSVFDPVTHHVYGLPGNGTNNLAWWRVSTFGATLGNSDWYQSGQGFGHFGGWAICADDLRIVVAGCHATNTICVLDLNTNTWSQKTNVSGVSYFAGGSGGVYIRANKSIAIGNPLALGQTIYKLQIPLSGGVYDPTGQWVWSTAVSNGSGPTTSIQGGIYSRWNIIPNMGDNRSALVVHGLLQTSPGVYSPRTYVYKIPSAGI